MSDRVTSWYSGGEFGWADFHDDVTVSPRKRPDAPTADRPRPGERYRWEGLTFTITRVSAAYHWADIKVEGPDGWTKRQPLPLPPGSVRIDEAGRPT